MTTTIELTREQKKELRNLYGLYKDIRRDEYSGCDPNDYKEDKASFWNDLKAKMIEFGLTGGEDVESLVYSPNQLQFIEDAEQGTGDLYFGYSGRGMYGDCCPALYCDDHNDITTTARTQTDSMGRGIVIYAQS